MLGAVRDTKLNVSVTRDYNNERHPEMFLVGENKNTEKKILGGVPAFKNRRVSFFIQKRIKQ